MLLYFYKSISYLKKNMYVDLNQIENALFSFN